MTALVIAEHDNSIRCNLNAVTAAKAAGGDVHVLVAGANAGAAAAAAAQIAGVTKVLHADGAQLLTAWLKTWLLIVGRGFGPATSCSPRPLR